MFLLLLFNVEIEIEINVRVNIKKIKKIKNWNIEIEIEISIKITVLILKLKLKFKFELKCTLKLKLNRSTCHSEISQSVVDHTITAIYLLYDMMQIQNVVVETRVQPFGTDLAVGELLPFVGGFRVPDLLVQLSKFVEHRCSQQILVPVLRRNNHVTESTWFESRKKNIYTTLIIETYSWTTNDRIFAIMLQKKNHVAGVN